MVSYNTAAGFAALVEQKRAAIRAAREAKDKPKEAACGAHPHD